MSEYSVVYDLPKNVWNSFLEKHSNGNFEQCFEYGEISKKAFPRSNAVRLAYLHGDELVGILQGTYSKYFGFGMSLGVMRGPVVNFNFTDYPRVIEGFLKALEDYARSNRVIEARVWVPQAWNADAIFNSSGYSLVGQYSEYVVDLEKSADDVWRSFSHNKRRNIKRAMSMGVEVVESRRMEDLLTFYSMLTAAERRGGFTSYPLSFFKAVWELYNPDLSKVFLARWNGKAVSGVFTVTHGKTVYALAAGSFSEGWRVRPNDIMHWKIMEWAMEKGHSRYQMGLVSDPPPSPESPSWGIWRWKREWRGSLEKINVFHKYFHQKYRVILKAKGLVEKTYQLTSRLMINLSYS